MSSTTSDSVLGRQILAAFKDPVEGHSKVARSCSALRLPGLLKLDRSFGRNYIIHAEVTSEDLYYVSEIYGMSKVSIGKMEIQIVSNIDTHIHPTCTKQVMLCYAMRHYSL